MTEKVSRGRSLNAKITYAVLVSLGIAVLAFFCLTGLGRLIINRVYMSQSAVESRKARIYSELSVYVAGQDVRGTDSSSLARWTGDNRYIILLVYNKNGELVMRASEGQAQSSSSMQTYERMQLAVEYGKLYPMRFSDGVYNVAIGDYTSRKQLIINAAASAAAAVLIFFAMLLRYVTKLTDRIIRLSREAVTIGSGDLEAPISTDGDDELSVLADEVDNMRRSVIERMGNERRAWEANSELITAMSHDIRTPMTSLIGYLELLSSGDFKDREKSREFCASACKKASELKELTDELFKYFLVFGRADLEMNMEVFDASTLLEQLLGEAQYELMNCGFDAKQIFFRGSCSIKADPMYLKRVVDNLISNIKKYADKGKPVVFLSELKNGELSVCVSNSIPETQPKVESTRIGIKTCEKIMQHMGGRFTTVRDDGHFAAEFVLPALSETTSDAPGKQLHKPQKKQKADKK